MIWLLVTFIVVLLLGAPIVFAFAFSSIVYLLFVSDLPSDMFGAVLYSSLDSFPLMAIPFFLFAGELMSQGGISKRIINFSRALVGKVKGFLGVITILASGFFSAVSGSGVATVAAVGGMMIPEMKRSAYPAGYAAALTASGAFLGSIIPPSIPMVMYGFISNTSIGDLFVAGVIPGFLFVIGFLLLNILAVRKFSLRESEAEGAGWTADTGQLRKLMLTGKAAFWALLMPVIIIGGIYGGFFTPTESAVVAVVYALLVSSLIFREMKWGAFVSATVSSALNTSMLLITLVFATIFSRLLTIEQVPQKLADSLLNVTEQQWAIMLIVILFLTLIGMLMDTVTGVILVTPIVFPILVTGVGMDPVHVGIITVVTLSVGLITPPMAINLFLAGKIADAPMMQIVRYLPGFLVVSYMVILLLSFLPELVLFLPKWMAG
ncbi:TRAP transporter large permease [Bhargavaea beijingensis]|uniref:TRAP transporter large permease n=1 Tax=Bhargavaea beijingensis TaxID=426756 RepID=UPI0022246D04|nr:TRAP transporter large permease [Bhargavaea beijingensis]MCW1927389.1 TRAP transporter large permease [Bhargavaea beijingensis]